MNNEITLSLTALEINLVLESLGSQPFVKVYTLIGKIQSQAAAELQRDHSVESMPMTGTD